MHLIIAASIDITSDIIVDSLGSKCLRLNNDRPSDHEIQINKSGFKISDKFGREVSNQNLSTLIVRKMQRPRSGITDEEMYAFNEHTRALESLMDYIYSLWPEKVPMYLRNITRITKFMMARTAEDFFRVPDWTYSTHPSNSKIINPVLKNLYGFPFHEQKGDNDVTKLMYVQPVKLSELADGWPWFLQEKVEAKYDLTVAFIDGQCFAMRLPRNSFDGLDWRKFIGTKVDESWELIKLDEKVSNSIMAYMNELKLNYGRLDFLYSNDDFSDLCFLEVNPHGQWAWMDLDKKNGIHHAMMRFLTTPRPI